MSSRMKGLAYLFFGMVVAVHGYAQNDEMSEIPQRVYETVIPTSDEGSMISQPLGYYAQGLLKHPFVFPNEGDGYVKVMRTKGRNYGTVGLFEVIAKAASLMRSLFPRSERLQLGDISGVHGGRISGHASHQNGLDVDIAYYRTNRREMRVMGRDSFDESFVTRRGVSPNFDLARNWTLFQLLVSTGKISRIFVDAKIKRTLCKYARSLGPLDDMGAETLRRLRPLTYHHDHMHVRVVCPRFSEGCVTQDDPPPGTGC